MENNAIRFLGAGMAILGIFGPAIAIGLIGKGAMDAIGRNPESSKYLQTNMVLAMVFAEAMAVLATLVAIMQLLNIGG